VLLYDVVVTVLLSWSGTVGLASLLSHHDVLVVTCGTDGMSSVSDGCMIDILVM